MSQPTAEGCAVCGVAYREHLQTWMPGIGWHGWIPPPRDLIAARIRQRLQAAGRLPR